MNDEQIQVTIEIFQDGIRELEGKKLGELLLSEQCNLKEFIQEIVKSLDSLLIKYGLVGYRENWSRADFPIGRYLKLKHFIQHNQLIDVENINKGEWNEYKRTSTFYELEILKSVFKED